MFDPDHYRRQSAEAMEQFIAHIQRLDEVIRRFGFHLHKLQPFHTGRITIEWVKKREVKVQRPAVWFFDKKTRLWSYDEIPLASLSIRNKRNGEFHDNAETVSAILGRVKDLIEARAATVKRFNDFRDAMAKAEAYREPMLAEMEHELHVYDREHTTPLQYGEGVDWTTSPPDDE